jgi:photosystem II stability/assembly factor-like uncharacterized protein
VKSLWLPLKWLPLCALLVLIGLGAAAGADKDKDKDKDKDDTPLPFKVEVVENVGVTEDLHAVRATDPKSSFNKGCIAVGVGGVMIRSDDGGKKWRKVKSNTTADLHDVRFLNTSVALAVGEGGKYPAPENKLPPGLTILDPIKGEHIIEGAHPWSTIMRTADGGKTWTRIKAPTNLSLTGVMWDNTGKRALAISGDFIKEKPGDGSILVSEDSGVSWKVLYNVGCPLRDIRILPDNTGLVVGWAAVKPDRVGTRMGFKKIADLTDQDKKDMPADLRRLVSIPDGWNTSAVALGPPQLALKTDTVGADSITVKEGAPLFGVQITPDRGWVVGEAGLLAHADRKNKKWGEWTQYEVDEKSKVNFRGIAFKEAKMINGLVIGEGGVLLGTVDSGKTWKRIDTGTDKALHGLMWNTEGAVIVGAEGTVLRVIMEKEDKK